MKVLVTGAAGLLGARLAELLVEAKHRVLGLDVLDGQDPQALQEARLAGLRADPRFAFRQADVTDLVGLEREVRAFRPDALVNLASRRDLQWAEEDPSGCYRLQVGGALAALRACRDENVPRVILVSSSHVYGGSRVYPFREDDPCDRPLSNLGAAQRAMELMASVHALRSPLSVSVARVFSLYGPRQSPRCLVPALCAAAERGEPMPLLGDGTAGRDLLHVDDAALGLLRLLERPAPFQVLNLGSGLSTTLGQVAEQVAYRMNVRLRLGSRPARPGEMPNTWADIERARAGLGFEPQVGLEEGLRRTVEWFRGRPDAFRP
ncbi:MAG TPA: NAD-dependent epimerase/dehydratase family protein [Myxococcota bacterium]|nr:NAD-dependent epimerase/dehydratase family protein [Myxococcota bacterium]HRY96770.1 NAD-dependent epimerase/dehydratase family protein [Myxococcota bacterium]HSA21547.1 NAD-dependent epimerase/dehydratase family protein [Myxococcota bacterium]